MINTTSILVFTVFVYQPLKAKLSMLMYLIVWSIDLWLRSFGRFDLAVDWPWHLYAVFSLTGFSLYPLIQTLNWCREKKKSHFSTDFCDNQKNIVATEPYPVVNLLYKAFLYSLPYLSVELLNLPWHLKWFCTTRNAYIIMAHRPWDDWKPLVLLSRCWR